MKQSKNHPQIKFNNQITKLYCYDHPQFLKQLKPILNQLEIDQVELEFDYEKDECGWEQADIDKIIEDEQISKANFGDDYYIKSFKLIYQDLEIVATNCKTLFNLNLIKKLLWTQDHHNQPIVYHTNNNNIIFYQSPSYINNPNDEIDYEDQYDDRDFTLQFQLEYPIDQYHRKQLLELLDLWQTLESQLVNSKYPGLKAYNQEHLKKSLDEYIKYYDDYNHGIDLLFSLNKRQNLVATQRRHYRDEDGYIDAKDYDFFKLIKVDSPLQKLKQWSWNPLTSKTKAL